MNEIEKRIFCKQLYQASLVTLGWVFALYLVFNFPRASKEVDDAREARMLARNAEIQSRLAAEEKERSSLIQSSEYQEASRMTPEDYQKWVRERRQQYLDNKK